MESKKFPIEKLAKLNDPKRLIDTNPDLLWGKLKLKSPKTLIDIGAGTGVFAVEFSKKMNNGMVYACDISDAMLVWMKDNLPHKLNGIVIPTKMEESFVPLPDGIADMVYMINLHHELEEPVKIVSEAFRLLSKDGKLMIIDWKKEETPEGPPLSIRVTEEDIAADMRKGGFSSIVKHRDLKYHNFIVGEKAQPELQHK